jgi:hypothetical protein
MFQGTSFDPYGLANDVPAFDPCGLANDVPRNIV